MRWSPRPFGLLLLALIGALARGTAGASAGDPMPAVRAGNFPQADARAAEYADPVARKLVQYYRLLTPGQASAAEIAAFEAANPDWPNQALLEKRRQEAIAREPDPAAARAACAQGATTAAALARCADALADGGETEAAITAARQAWVASVAPDADAAGFLARWKSALRPQDQWARFDRLAWNNNPEAAEQIGHLIQSERDAAQARLALRHDAPNADKLLGKLTTAERDDPAMVLDYARWLRRQKRIPDAVVLWTAKGFAAEQAAAADRRAAFWAERNILARQLLALGDNQDAYTIADDSAQTGADAAASAFLAGFIALRRLSDAETARMQFQRLTEGKAAITQARAHYWLARTDAALGKDSAADDAKAAAFPLTFYGQLAARASGLDEAALDARIRALTDPGYTTDIAWDFTGRELIRAATMLAAWGELGRARGFLLRAQETANDPAQQALAARLALNLGMPDTAVFIARRMGVEGLELPQAGWPEPVSPPDAPQANPLDPAITLALIRQESSFDAGAISAVGARGLMQLMPATAQVEAQRGGGSVTNRELTADPTRNMELGASYMRSMLARFDGSLPLAVAAYNAGPNRVDQWLRDNGDPRTGQVGMIDWIELIPFEETRNYVERVLENVVIYQTRRGKHTGSLTAQWMR